MLFDCGECRRIRLYADTSVMRRNCDGGNPPGETREIPAGMKYGDPRLAFGSLRDIGRLSGARQFAHLEGEEVDEVMWSCPLVGMEQAHWEWLRIAGRVLAGYALPVERWTPFYGDLVLSVTGAQHDMQAAMQRLRQAEESRKNQ